MLQLESSIASLATVGVLFCDGMEKAEFSFENNDVSMCVGVQNIIELQ